MFQYLQYTSRTWLSLNCDRQTVIVEKRNRSTRMTIYKHLLRLEFCAAVLCECLFHCTIPKYREYDVEHIV